MTTSSQNSSSSNGSEATPVITSGFYNSLDAFLNSEHRAIEPILLSLRRGQIGLLISATNVGKSTLALNLGLKLAAGESFPPFQQEPTGTVRVMYVDFEADATELDSYIKKMLSGIRDKQSALENFIPIVEAEIKDEAINFSRPDHRNYILNRAKELKVDLLIIDNLSSAFSLKDENSNAETTLKIIRPLKRLAQIVGCAVLLIHHSGKPSEGTRGGGEAAYSGRGASALGCLTRVVFTLTKDTAKGDNYVNLTCAKSKGAKFSPTVLYLNPQTRWFEVCDEMTVGVSSTKPTLSAQDIAAFVCKHGEASKSELYAEFEAFSPRTIDNRTLKAAELGLIKKPIKKGKPWRVAEANP